MSWGAIGAAAVTAVASNQQRKSAQKAADAQRAAAAEAAKGAAFDPYNVSGLFGAGTFTPAQEAQYDPETGELIQEATSAQAGIGLSPQMQQYADILQQQAGGFLGQGQTDIGRQAGALGAGFLGGVQTDPFASAQTQFGRMEAILAPARQRQREALEGRLLRQGRLGSTGGALQQQGLETAIEESRQKGLYDALAQSQALTGQQVGLGTQLGLLGQQQQDVGFQQAQARLGALSGIDQQALQYLNLGGAFGGRAAQAGAQAGAFNLQGAAAGTAAQLGATAGQTQALGKLSGALASANWGSGSGDVTATEMLQDPDQDFYA